MRDDPDERPHLTRSAFDEAEPLDVFERERGERAAGGVLAHRDLEDEQLDQRAERLRAFEAPHVQRDVDQPREDVAPASERGANALPGEARRQQERAKLARRPRIVERQRCACHAKRLY